MSTSSLHRLKIIKRKTLKGKFIKRYKRFLADIKLDNGEVITAHCTNTGSLKSCLIEGADAIVSKADNPARKTRFTWEMIKVGDAWVGVNTQNANIIAFEILKRGLIPNFEKIQIIKREARYLNSRFDLYVESNVDKIFIEVKNVTYRKGNSAQFPDAETKRGQKHIEELVNAKESGYRTALFFIIQRDDIKTFQPANDIDPKYSKLLKLAANKGIEIYPIKISVTPECFEFKGVIDAII